MIDCLYVVKHLIQVYFTYFMTSPNNQKDMICFHYLYNASCFHVILTMLRLAQFLQQGWQRGTPQTGIRTWSSGVSSPTFRDPGFFQISSTRRRWLLLETLASSEQKWTWTEQSRNIHIIQWDEHDPWQSPCGSGPWNAPYWTNHHR